jgi:hypothetical protein
MTPRHPARLTATLLATLLLAACNERPAPPPAAVTAPAPTKPAAPVPQATTREQATAMLLALPEVQRWSRDIEQRSHGKVHGAILEDDPTPRLVNGEPYWQLSFVENRADAVHRRASFLVARNRPAQILVEDPVNDTVVALADWRRSIRRVELKAAD